MKRKKRQNKGMSYLEVMICFLMIAIVVLPLSLSFVSSTKLREESLNLSQSTFYAETLLEEVKNQLTEDLIQKKKVENGGGGSIPSYLKEGERVPAPEFLNKLFKSKTAEGEYLSKEDVRKKYVTDKYSYEVALWSLKKILPKASEKNPVDPNLELMIDKNSLEKATKWYTDAAYCFSDETVDFPKLQVNKGNVGLFRDKAYIESDHLDEKTKVAFKNFGVISLENEEINPKKLKPITQKKLEHDKVILSEPKKMTIKTPTQGNAYVFEIKEKTPGGSRVEVTKEPLYLILDTRKLNISTLEINYLTIKNKTDHPLNIKLIASNNKDELDIKTKMKLIFENEGMGCINLENTVDVAENYIIGMVVRNKSPKLGKKGKIVKTMLEVYTFEPQLMK